MSRSRRDFLGMLGSAAAASALPATAHAELAPEDRQFVFVYAMGGWDPTFAVSPMHGRGDVHVEADATVRFTGSHRYVDHVERPSVRRFFTEFGDRTAVVHGMIVRSVNHVICARLLGTATPGIDDPDWPTLIGAHRSDHYRFPSMVLGGFTAPGNLDRYSVIVGKRGQLQELLDQSVYATLDRSIEVPHASAISGAEALLQERLRRRVASEPEDRLLGAYADGVERVRRALGEDLSEIDLGSNRIHDQALSAVALLNGGAARCVSLGLTGFDTHGENWLQSDLHETLFEGIYTLVSTLASRRGRVLRSMLDETTVVVLSEMGRTPWSKISNGGKDHWPYTSAMLIGSGVRGGYQLGGFDDDLQGQPVDVDTGRITPSGNLVHPGNLGTTLLHLAGMDIPERLRPYPPVSALLG